MKMYRESVELAGDNQWLSPDSVVGPLRAWYYVIVYTQSALCIHGFCICSFNQPQTETSEKKAVSVLNMSKLCSYNSSIAVYVASLMP